MDKRPDEHMPLNVRLNAKTERLLNALAKRRGQTRSDIVREAIEQFGQAQISSTQRRSAYDHWVDVIGVAHSRPRLVQDHRRAVRRHREAKGQCAACSSTRGRLSR
jgi:hypothetical protein